MREIRAPIEYKKRDNEIVVFLAGSIEEGRAVDWQEKAIKMLASIDNLLVLNPRRNFWDNSVIQSIDDKKFREQVAWQQDGLEGADFIVFYFDKDTKSPIALLELGLFIRKNIIVCCPTGFWRKGNVDFVCERHGVRVVETLNELIVELFKRIKMSRQI